MCAYRQEVPGGPTKIGFKELARELKRYDKNELNKGLQALIEENRRIRPSFSPSWVFPEMPYDAEKLISYQVSGSSVTLFNLPDEVEVLYYVLPPEYQLPMKEVKMIMKAREEIRGHFPTNIDITKPDQVRSYVEKVGERIIYGLSKREGLSLGNNRAREAEKLRVLSEILAKYTAGFGISEVLLRDEHIQDVYIDAPASENLVYATLGGFDDPRITGKCRTNVCLGGEDADSLLSRFRYESGRPFSEAMPVLETDLDFYNIRVTAIGKPLSPGGIAIALRRHSTDPWTLLRLAKVRSLNPLASGLISFLIDGRSTMLVAGSRGAGKTSLLSAIMFEFPQSQRILTIEDTLELPGPEMQSLGFKVQSLFVQSTIGGKGELTADDALRVSLRLGESSIVLGEVRGQEARTLYEAMRAGTAGSSVLGTIHGNSPKAVYERVVHDMGIPAKAFSATDVIVIAGLTRPGGRQHQKRRVTEISELDKDTMEFHPLLKYDPDSDELVETDRFLNSSSKIASIAKSWGIEYEEAVLNIRLRGAIREVLVNAADEDPKYLNAKWVARANNKFWNLVDECEDLSDVEDEWYDWFFEQRGMA